MQLTQLSATLFASPQLQPADLAELQRAGFRSVICNRPDGEEPGQPSFRQIESEAHRVGMQARYQPVLMATMAPADGAAFAALLSGLPSPVVAYCRSGKRSASLWALAPDDAARADA